MLLVVKKMSKCNNLSKIWAIPGLERTTFAYKTANQPRTYSVYKYRRIFFEENNVLINDKIEIS